MFYDVHILRLQLHQKRMAPRAYRHETVVIDPGAVANNGVGTDA